MKPRTAIAALVLLFATGLACGWTLRPSKTDSAPAGRAEPVNRGAEEALALSSLAASPAPTNHEPPPQDFAARLDRIASLGNRLKRARAVAAIADDLSAAEVSAALDQLAKLGDRGSGIDRSEIAEKLFARWGELDPTAAFQRALGFPMERRISVRAVIRGWATVDATAAEAWLADFHSPLQDTARRGLITAVAETDPKRAFALLEGLVTHWGDPSLAEAVFSPWLGSAPAEAAAQAAQLPAGYFRKSALGLIAREWAATDGSSAVAWAAALSDSGKTPDGRSFPFPADPLTTALKVWLDQDAAAANDWLQNLPDEKQRRAAITSLISLTADDDPHSAAQMLEKMMPAGKERDEAIKDLAERWSRGDPGGAIAWAQAQTDAHTRGLVTREIAFQLVNEGNLNPQNTSAVLELAQTLSGETRVRATAHVLDAWAFREPAAAAAWAARFPGQREYLSAVARGWVMKDPSAAQAWVDSLQEGSVKDQVLFDVATAAVQMNPEVACHWGAQVRDPQKREVAYKEIAKRWLQADVKAARAWIATLPLSQEVKDQMLKAYAR